MTDSARWAVWYSDRFDADSSPSIDVEGQGLENGLAELWARTLFESFRPSGGSGFSSFHLRCDRGRIDIRGSSDGATRLRHWLFGDAETVRSGYVADADSLLVQLAQRHAELIADSHIAEKILGVAASSAAPADFSDRLSRPPEEW